MVRFGPWESVIDDIDPELWKGALIMLPVGPGFFFQSCISCLPWKGCEEYLDLGSFDYGACHRSGCGACHRFGYGACHQNSDVIFCL